MHLSDEYKDYDSRIHKRHEDTIEDDVQALCALKQELLDVLERTAKKVSGEASVPLVRCLDEAIAPEDYFDDLIAPWVEKLEEERGHPIDLPVSAARKKWLRERSKS